jgi:hypothetical protein
MLGFWLCLFNIGILEWGLCLSSWTKCIVWLLEFNNVVQDRVGEVEVAAALGGVCANLRSVRSIRDCLI